MILPIYVPVIASLASFAITFFYCKNHMTVNDLQDENANSERRKVQGLTALLAILIVLVNGLSFIDVSKSDVAYENIGMAIFFVGILNALIAYSFVLTSSRKLKGYDIKEVEEKYFLRNVNYSLGSVLNVIAMTGFFFMWSYLLTNLILKNLPNNIIGTILGIGVAVLDFALPLYLDVAIPKCVRKYVFRRYRKASNQ